VLTPDNSPRFMRAAFASLLLLAACDETGESPTGPSVRRSEDKGTYDASSLPRSLFSPSSGLAPRRAPLATGMSAAATANPRGKPSPLANGSFELNGGPGTNQLTEWTVVDNGFTGSWWVQHSTGSPFNSFMVEQPTDGGFAAMTDQTGPGLHILYQDIQVPHGPAILSFDLYINNLAGEFYTPTTLSPDIGVSNQQFRVDVMDPSAPLEDLGGGVLLPVYRTREGDQVSQGYQTISVSLKQFVGRSVRLRFAEVDNQYYFLVGIDRVQLGHKPRPVKQQREPRRGRAAATGIPFAPESGPFAHGLTLGDDQTSGPLPIGFDFEFFGAQYRQINVASNGFVSFETDALNGCCSGRVIPSDDGMNNLIALAWTDLYPPGGGEIAYETRGTAPNRRLIVSFSGISWFPEFGMSRVTTQLILRERKSVIEIHTTHQEPGHIYTQGVENADGTVAAFIGGRVAADYGLDRDGVRFTTSAH
jgi:hypothetical protein